MEKLTQKIVQEFYPKATSIKIGAITEETDSYLKEVGVTHRSEVAVTETLPMFNKKIKNFVIFILLNGTWKYYSQK